MSKPVLLIVRDGWGENPDPNQASCNAITLANVPFSRDLSAHWPRSLLMAHGLDVGLPGGVMGNSEVGHQNIGAGRIVDQEIVRLNKVLFSPDIKNNPVLVEAIARVKENDGTLHLIGMVSDAGVHSMIDHAIRLWEVAAEMGVKDIAVHAFTDGRDTPPMSGMRYVDSLLQQGRRFGVGQISSVCGRYWAMDRDKRWDRVARAYNMLTGKSGARAQWVDEAIQGYYNNPSSSNMVGDEFITPTLIADEKGNIHPIRDGDSVVFFNFRGDRPREIIQAFTDPNFTSFDRGKMLDLFFVTLTEYESGLCPNVLFPKLGKMPYILGEVISSTGLKQFRTAETEKYPHVTFFFNDYREEPFPGEDRDLVSSPREVSTYDQKPAMNAQGVTAAAKKAILSGQYSFILVNYANADMVGHSGSLPAAIAACEAVDQGVHELLDAVNTVGGAAIITADHGNAEQMYDPVTKTAHTRHTLNPVECILFGPGLQSTTVRPSGRLADIAPTVLDLLGIPKPVEMTGESLLVK
jgi:2,3-bisphosphoglycerate-independent phosphoglycerate mutase